MSSRKETSDLGLAAYLSHIGHKLVSVPMANGGRAVFTFEHSREIEEDILQYFNRKACVEPLGFLETHRNLKGLTH